MKLYHKSLDIYLLILLGIFFIWHIFHGSLGLIAAKEYKKQIVVLQAKQKQLLALQRKLNHDITCIKDEINRDYLECLAMENWKKVDPKTKILKIHLIKNEIDKKTKTINNKD